MTINVARYYTEKAAAELLNTELHPWWSQAPKVHASVSMVMTGIQAAVEGSFAQTDDDQVAVVAEAASMWLQIRVRSPEAVAALFAELAVRHGAGASPVTI